LSGKDHPNSALKKNTNFFSVQVTKTMFAHVPNRSCDLAPTSAPSLGNPLELMYEP